MSIVRSAAVVGSLVSLVAAHGYVSGIVADGVYYLGYNPAFQYANPAPAVAGWSDPEDLGNGFIDPNNYTTPEIICVCIPGITASSGRSCPIHSILEPRRAQHQ